MSSRGRLAAGDVVLFVDRKQRQYLKTLKAGTKLSVQGGRMECDELIGLPAGSRVKNSVNETFLVFHPSYAELVLNLPRQAQVIYPKDVGPILLWGDVRPGLTVVESGIGPGALSIALLRAIGPEGRLVSYEIRPDFADLARGTVARFHGEAPNWTIKIADVHETLDEPGADRVVLDLPEPWRLLDRAAASLVPGGLFVGYVPTVLQVKALVDALHAHDAFGMTETFETLQRFWHVRELSIRPQHRMVAHTGFVTVARRLAVAADAG